MRYVMDPSFHSTWCLSCYETLPNHISTGIGDIEKTSLRLREIEQNEKEQVIIVVVNDSIVDLLFPL